MIYITTHHRVINYGAALQSYALQQFLNSLGYDNNLLYVDEKHTKNSKPTIKTIIQKCIQLLYGFVYKKEINEGLANFQDFFENYHTTTRKYNGLEDLKENPPLDGVYLSGSDQVFHPLNNKPHFFLQFGPEKIKRISYAASMGISNVPESLQEEFRNYLSCFDSISIRESYSKKVIENFYNRDVTVNVDPSYLVEKSHWESICSNTIKIDKPYILVYSIYTPKWLSSYLKKIYKESGIEIVLVSYGQYRTLYKNKYVKNAGPREFLSLIANASMVISSSYHGNVFATIFRKPFYAVVNPASPARIMSMLELFGFEDRKLTPETELDFNINYGNFEKILKDERKKSEEYLKNVLEG